MAVWFDFLEKRGFFKPEKNPDPVQVKDGINVPYWEALTYLEKLSLEIKEGNELDSIQKIINIITNVSNHPKDNYRTWYVFTKILGNLPNDKIPQSIFQFVPVWLGGRFETSIQTSELTEHLIPKFLNDSPTAEDVAKAEIILKALFKLRRLKNADGDDLAGEGYGYKSVAHLYFLKASLVDKGLIPKIIAHCSDEVIYSVAESVKLILLDFPRGIRVPSEDAEGATIVARIRGKNLTLESKQDDETETRSQTVPNFESLDDQTLEKTIGEFFSEYRVDLRDSFTKSIMNRLFEDLNSQIILSPVAELQDEAKHGDNLKDSFTLILRDLFTEKGKQKPLEAVFLFENFLNSRVYRLIFFKRLILYAIGANWNAELRDLFRKMVKSGATYFRDYKYEPEIRYILQTNANALNDDDIKMLDGVIEQGSAYNETHDIEYWRWRIFGALRANPHYAQRFLELSEKLNISVAELGSNSRYSIAQPVNFDSPLAAAEIKKTSHEDILKAIETLKPDSWQGPSHDGFARQLGKAVEEEPAYFSDSIFKYLSVTNIYAFYLLDGFREAWKNKRSFDWGAVLSFCKAYISSLPFQITGLVTSEDDEFGANHGLVLGAIGNLITEGTQHDESSFDPMHLPIAGELLTYIIPRLKVVNSNDSQMGHVMSAFNSTAGKAIRGLLDLSLRKGRLAPEGTGRWDPALKVLFIEALERKFIDSYVFTGLYYEQLFFLDPQWITEQFKKLYDLEEKYWLGFIEGFFFSNPPYNEEVYRLSIPHYERAIHRHQYGSEHYRGNGISQHLGVIYLREYETLFTDNVLTKFLTRSNPEAIQGFVSFLRLQEKYIMGLPMDDRQSFQLLVIGFWIYIVKLLVKPEGDEELNILSNLNTLISYIETLNDTTTDLIIGTVGYVDRNYNTHHVVDVLNKLKMKGHVKENALRIGKILNAIGLNDYLKFSEKGLLSLIEFVYEHGHKELANLFCNKLGMLGYEFQKPVFAKYNA
jgi:hypothetical protein